MTKRAIAIGITAAATFVFAAQASVIYVNFGSGIQEVSETNSLTGANVPTIPSATWHDAILNSEWESTGGIPSSNVTFSFVFNVLEPMSGWVGVLADGPAKVMFDGWLLADMADGGVGSVTPVWLNLPYIFHGLNTLTVTLGSGSYALDVYGEVEAIYVSPEPIPAVIVGLGLLALGLIKRRTNDD